MQDLTSGNTDSVMGGSTDLSPNLTTTLESFPPEKKTASGECDGLERLSTVNINSNFAIISVNQIF